LEVVQAGFHLTLTGEMPMHLWESFQRAIVGLMIGGSIGFVFGLLNGLVGPADLLFDSSLQMLRNIPHLAMIPLVILWFGIGEPAKLFLIEIGVFFPMYVNTIHGIRSTDPKLIEMGRIYGLSPWELVKANVALAAPRNGRRDRVAEDALEHVGLGDRAHEWPSILSGGQRQRVALARALASDADLLLFDEPLGALDALTRLEMQALIERLWLERRFSAILVTHDVEEAVALADRILLMDGGRVTFETVVSLERPRDRATAEFTSLKEAILERILGRGV
jgi:ABC-type nitrate/sulfonate/bicarbonate transport system ATPase subunit